VGVHLLAVKHNAARPSQTGHALHIEQA
jgi:hypothetical protein